MFFSRRAGHRYIDRGDIASADFETTDFTESTELQELDLSEIIPKNTVLVLGRLVVIGNAPDKRLFLLKGGYTNFYNLSDVRTQIDGVPISENVLVPPDQNGIIQYKRVAGEFSFIEFTIRGWWV